MRWHQARGNHLDYERNGGSKNTSQPYSATTGVQAAERNETDVHTMTQLLHMSSLDDVGLRIVEINGKRHKQTSTGIIHIGPTVFLTETNPHILKEHQWIMLVAQQPELLTTHEEADSIILLRYFWTASFCVLLSFAFLRKQNKE